MTAVNVLAKKSFPSSANEQLVYVKQFLIVRENGKKFLVLRLVNGRAETVNSVELSVVQCDGDDNELSKSTMRVQAPNGGGAAGRPFVPEQKIALEENTVDCRVAVVSATYGNYTYRAGQKNVAVEYNGDDNLSDGVKKYDVSKAGKDGVTVKRRTMHVPALVIFALFIVLALTCGGVYAHLVYFVNTEKTFLYSGVEYAFENDDKSDGSNIYVVGYHGNRSRIVIPSSIEGHKVTHVADGAFSGNRSVTSVGFQSEIPVGNYAFSGCVNLRTVDFEKITSFGRGAFLNCTKLTSVTISSDITILPDNVFGGCAQLATVRIKKAEPTDDEIVTLTDDSIKLGENAFAHCTNIKSFVFERKIDFAYNGGNRNWFNGSRIGKLHLVDYDVSDNQNGRDHISSMFGYSESYGGDVQLGELIIDKLDFIPEAFCFNLPITSFEVKDIDSSVIPDAAFLGCSNLTQFKYPKAITHVGNMAFGYTALTAFDGNALEFLGSGAFNNCGSLKAFTFNQNTTLTEIGDGAFMNCRALVTFTFPKNVNTISSYLFADCTALESVTFARGSSVSYIASNAFDNSSSLKSMALPDDALEYIGQMAFNGCSKLAAFDITENVTILGDYAFSNCTSLSEFTVPDNVQIIGNGLLRGCSSLERLTVPFIGNTEYGNTYLSYVFGAESSYTRGSLVVPESLKTVTVTGGEAVFDRAFYGCNGIENVYLPSGIISIGENAFYECSKLKSIDIPVGVDRIGVRAFSHCEALTEIAVPSSVYAIGRGAFFGCSNLQTLTVPFVGEGSYGYNDYLGYMFGADIYFNSGMYVPQSLKTVEVTETVSLGAYAFAYCEYLENIELSDTLVNIGDYAFSNCASLKIMTLPDSVGYVGSSVFFNTPIEELTVPYVGQRRVSDLIDSEYYRIDYMFGFEMPYMLKKVTLTDCVAIAPFAFSDCRRLEQIVLDCDVSKIGYDAFYRCYKLYEIFNYSGLTLDIGSIDNGRIAEIALKVHTTRDEECLPRFETADGFVFIGDGEDNWYMFEYNNYDEKPVFPHYISSGEYSFASYTLWNHLFENSDVVSSVTLPSSVVGVRGGAFFSCQNLESVDFSQSSSVVEINAETFAWCRKLTSVILPPSLEYIDSYAFIGCERLKTIKLPSTLSTRGIGSEAFASCTRLFEVYNFSTLDIEKGSYTHGRVAENARAVFLSDDEAIDKITVGGVQYFKLCDDGIDWWAVDYVGTDGNLSIVPFEFGGRTIDEIGIFASAFTYYYNFRNVVVSSAVKSLGGVFSSTGVQRVTLVGGGKYDKMEIQDEAFSYCYSLESFRADVPISTFGSRVFTEAYSLSSVRFTERVDEIASEAFLGESAALSVNFADVGTIKANAFSSSHNLKSVAISGSVGAIENRAFNACGGLTSVTVGDVNTIGEYAFAYCERLVTVRFGNVSSIGDCAFRNSTALSSATFGTVESIGESAFESCGYLSTVNIATGQSLTIGGNAFNNCVSLSEFVYGGHIESIGARAFNYCSRLSRLSLNTVDGIQQYAFADCSSLNSVVFSGNVGVIGSHAFYAVPITTLRFNGSVDEIGASAFYYSQMSALDFSGSVGKIGESAFYSSSIGSLNFAGNVDEIGRNAFAYCFALERVTFGGTLGKIGEYAFSNCAFAEIVLPDNLTDIPSRAFANNRNLNKVTLPRDLVSLNGYAFSGCNYIFSVYNRSRLTFSNASDYFGDVLVVTDVASDANFVTASVNELKFVKASGAWWLYYIEYWNGDMINLPKSFTVNGETVNRYAVRNYASTFGRVNVFVGKAVTGVHGIAFDSGTVIYFDGDVEDWRTVGGGSTLYTVLYYSDCIHDGDSNHWRYDASNNPTRSNTQFAENAWTVTEQPTCTKTGVRKAECPHCKRTFEEDVAKLPHSFGSDEKCSMCGAKRVVVTSGTAEELSSFIQNDEKYPFEISASGEIKSTNKDDDSLSTFKVIADRAMTVSFTARASCELTHDKLIVSLKSTIILTLSGTQSQGLTLELAAGDILEFTYSKDVSLASNDDCIYINNLTFIYTEDV
ncbi:MAG: leucine-rich repeat domain-containing protein [Clostridiales bacterium]|nr:leucine-rich repeat domain-containing protein [Clostridiales bacterium]